MTNEEMKAENATLRASLDDAMAELEAARLRETVTRVRFTLVAKATEKGPKYRYQVFLSGPLSGTVLSGPVFIKDGMPSPGIASIYGDAAVQPAQIRERFNNHDFYRVDSDGEAKISNWAETLRLAFIAWKATGADQPVSFSTQAAG